MLRLRHPPGLYVLFFTEMWERFSFYTMNAVFVLYMTWEGNGHSFLQRYASLIYGSYLGAVYFMPFPGGVLADRQIGYKKAVAWGAIVMGVGHLLLAVDHLAFFFAGLAALSIGNGLFKPNISTLVGKLYAPGDPRLDNAYTIFYMGINLGAFLAPLAAGLVRVQVGQRYGLSAGYHAAFGMAGIGMGISLVLFLALQRFLVFTDYRGAAARAPLTDEEVPVQVQRRRHTALLIVFVIVALFWAVFKQNGNTFPRWFRSNTDRTPPSWLARAAPLLDEKGQITAEYVSSINPLYVILFSLPLAWLWGRLGAARREPSTPAKIGLGMLFTAAGFAVLLGAGLAGADEGMRVSPLYLLGALALVTLGELSLSPIGLSLVSKLAAPRSRSAWMGGWFAATAAGGYLAGLLGQYWGVWKPSSFFAVCVAASLSAFVILLACYRVLRNAMPAPRGLAVMAPAVQTNGQETVTLTTPATT